MVEVRGSQIPWGIKRKREDQLVLQDEVRGLRIRWTKKKQWKGKKKKVRRTQKAREEV